ncbi:MAG: hypothetical protein ABSH24_22275 [Bryobacteraceae bacterium]|jgi:hypothetical protein
MASTTTTISSVSTASVRTAAERVPWYVWCAVFGVTSAMIGGQWDISWHRSIGRDTFWTPAHIAIYMCGVLAGLSCGYLILATTFGNLSQLRGTSVKMWGFEAPLGAFIAAWGGVAMLASAPFDDWWHSAYGLDVKILSPPHVLLILGNLAVNTGTLILILGMMNRARASFRSRLEWLFLYVGGVVLVGLMLMIMEFSWHSLMHNGIYYRVVCMVVPLVLAGVARASEKRWAATTVTAVYWLFWAGMGWILPLFPAEPKLGPVYHQVTQFVPPEFPMLLFIPALALDLLWSRTRDWNLWKRSAVSGLVFLALLIAVQWPFSSFLQLPAARNWVFHTNIFDYNAHRAWMHYVFTKPDAPLDFLRELCLAAAAAIVTVRLGFAWGDWMRRVRR